MPISFLRKLQTRNFVSLVWVDTYLLCLVITGDTLLLVELVLVVLAGYYELLLFLLIIEPARPSLTSLDHGVRM